MSELYRQIIFPKYKGVLGDHGLKVVSTCFYFYFGSPQRFGSTEQPRVSHYTSAGVLRMRSDRW